MSTNHAQLHPVLRTWVLEDCGSKNGTFVNAQRVERHELRDGDVVEMGHSFFVFRQQPEPLDLAGQDNYPLLATRQPALAKKVQALHRLAVANLSIVLIGETGTGKEVTARAIHQLSRRTGPFIAVNCGAIPSSLAESELFGYRRGAFSGALEDRPGLVRSANGGTLFLDEIGDFPISLQATLLRVLQEGEVMPVGSARSVPVDLRVVVATHRDLDAMVQRGTFRADLLARLAGYTFTLLPLRDRREDMGLLIASLLQRHGGEAKVSLSLGAARAFMMHPWPLNVRQLEKCLLLALALCRGSSIDLEHLPDDLRLAQGLAGARPPEQREQQLTPRDQRRRKELVALLRETRGNVTAAAARLGTARVQLQRWMKRYAIDRRQFDTDS